MREPLQQFGITRHDGVLLRFAGAYQRDDTGEVDAVEITVRGRHSAIDMGTGKPGDNSQFKVTTEVSYYKMTINGNEVIEIDIMNMIERIDGVDRLADQRRAIGL
jgi:P2 family phage contractile tail tube protein